MNVKQNFWDCREWLNKNSDTVFDGRKEEKLNTEFEDIKEAIKQMSKENQKDTTIDYNIIKKEYKFYNNENMLYEEGHSKHGPEQEPEMEM